MKNREIIKYLHQGASLQRKEGWLPSVDLVSKEGIYVNYITEKQLASLIKKKVIFLARIQYFEVPFEMIEHQPTKVTTYKIFKMFRK